MAGVRNAVCRRGLLMLLRAVVSTVIFTHILPYNRIVYLLPVYRELTCIAGTSSLMVDYYRFWEFCQGEKCGKMRVFWGVDTLTLRAVFCYIEAQIYKFLEDTNEGKAPGRSGYGETGKK